MVGSLRQFGPASLGGLGELRGEIDAEAARQGRSAEEVASSVVRRSSGKVVHATGLPDAYDYEAVPQEVCYALPCCTHTHD
jgi:hypothetical protein